jgi:uncharacterized membrane protein YebE (DUF533 family)
MKRLTISPDACVEALAILISMAWADGRLDDREKKGVRAAASVFNLTKELRDRLDNLLEKPMPVEELLVDSLAARDKAFLYVAAAWMAGIDDDVDPKEQALLDKAGALLGFNADRRNELARLARDLPPKKDREWADEVIALFRAIPQRLEGDGSETFEVAFE